MMMKTRPVTGSGWFAGNVILNVMLEATAG